MFHLDSSGDTITWRITAPQPGEALSTFSGTITRDVAELSALDPPPQSQRDVQDRMKWGGNRAAEALRAYRSESAPGAIGAAGVKPGAPRSGDIGVGARSTPPEKALEPSSPTSPSKLKHKLIPKRTNTINNNKPKDTK